MKKKKEKFQMEITGKYKDAWTGQANEAVRIFSRSGQELLNSKSEFNQPPLARIVIEKKVKVWPKVSRPQLTEAEVWGVMLLGLSEYI